MLTLELSDEYTQVARRKIGRADLEEVIEVRVGPATGTLKRLIAESHAPFDLIFIDADEASYADYLELRCDYRQRVR